MTGTIQKVFLPNGYAFVKSDENGKEYFLHAKEVPEGKWTGDFIRKGKRVDFVPLVLEGGKLRATGAQILS